MVPNVPKNQERLPNKPQTLRKWLLPEVLLIWMKTSMGDQDFDMEDFDQEGFDIGGGTSNPYEEEKY